MEQPSLTARLSAEIRAEIARQKKVISSSSGVAGLSETSLRRTIRGERSMTLEELAAISTWLGVGIPDLLERCAPQPHHGGAA